MTKAKRPAKTPAILAPEPGARDRVRERMRQMAKLALLAATPLTNAACDPAVPPSPFGAGGAGGGGGLPTPTCEKSAADWAQFIHAEAAWGTEASERIVLLTVTNPEDKPWLQAPGSYTIEGGTLLPSTAREPDVLRIKPDAGATMIRLQGTATCHIIAEPMTIAITLTTANTNPFVVITTG